ncbi:MAG: aspartokinase/homoserine dehydrogenase 1 [Saprospiraceae bacterium]|jgi:aspartokinase/homoserine dehydrogenase 1
MKVLKFGGSSVATPQRILSIVEILKSYEQRGEQFAVVFSAFGGVTDTLLNMSHKAEEGDISYLDDLENFKVRHIEVIALLLSGELFAEAEKAVEIGFEELEDLLHGIYLLQEASMRSMDYVVSFGERNSSFIIAKVLKGHGMNAEYLDARKLIQTDKTFSAAKVDFEATNRNILTYFAQANSIQIITGFIASTEEGITTTLGRGGSDYTVAIFGAALSAEVIEIWTDVDGVMTADPRKVYGAFTQKTMTYAEAMEMSHFGAKVIYPPTIVPALQKNIPLRIRNTFNPTFPGTLISDYHEKNDSVVKGISSIGDVALLTLEGNGMVGVIGVSGRLFSALAKSNVNVILITQGSSEHSISFAVKPQDAGIACVAIELEFEYEINQKLVTSPRIETDLSVIAVIGENMRYRSGMAGRMFQSLGKNGVNIIAIAQGSSELNISAVIKKSDEHKALNALHEGFFESDLMKLHLFVVGVGLIGKTLLKQIQETVDYLKENRGLEIRVVALSNSRKMVFANKGIDLDNWENVLNESNEKADITTFIDKMKSLNLRNSIFIDNTANATIPNHYAEILESSISVSTPNKIAPSSAFANYQNLKNIADAKSVRFAFETNVGAGLPILTTLNDLMASGDEILKIEGVLSGSLSYIFNNFKVGESFYDIVKKAQELGFTEPDPREDLGGKDVARKLLILARESGLVLEADDIEIKNFLPQACFDAATVDDFFEVLNQHNSTFENMVEAADKADKKLRIIASLEGKKASISLQAVGPENPFYGLSGSDNMISFTTPRYKERPLVIRGPGAGAEVTAAGVFAEIISIATYLA